MSVRRLIHLFGFATCITFNQLKFQTCRNVEPVTAGFFEINFYSHCGNIGTKNVQIEPAFEFKTVQLLPVPMDSLHTITVQWKGRGF